MQRRDGLEAKFKLLATLPYDKRAKRKHCLVYGFILDWYHSKYGDALASVRHVSATLKERDPFGAGLFTGDIHTALTDLVAWGYLDQEKGSGRRASRYVPVWGKLDSVRETPNATDDDDSVRETPNASVRETPNATGASVHKSPNEDPPTLTRLLEPGTGKDEHDCLPPTVGLAATAAEQGGFGQLYSAYGVRKDKADARRAYDKLAPDADLHARMVEAANTWREAAGSIERMRLRRWIEEERYDEEPKGARPAKADSKPTPAAKPPATVNEAEPVADNDNVEPFRRETLTIINAFTERDDEYEDGAWVNWLHLEYRQSEDGSEDKSDAFIVESSKAELQDEGLAEYRAHLRRIGVHRDVDGLEELVGVSFFRTLQREFSDWEYEPDWTPAPRKARLPPGPRLWERPLVPIPRDQPGTIDWSKYSYDDDHDEEVEDAA